MPACVCWTERTDVRVVLRTAHLSCALLPEVLLLLEEMRIPYRHSQGTISAMVRKISSYILLLVAIGMLPATPI